MKQDLELIRKILFKIEEQEEVSARISGKELQIPGYTSDEIIYQLLLLKEKDYIVAAERSFDDEINVYVSRMTWDGHEFLAAARNETNWKKAKKAAEKTGSLLVEVMKPILIEMATSSLRSALRLP